MFLSTGRVATQAGPVFEQLTVFDGVSVSYCDSETRKEQYKPILQTTQFFENCESAYVDMIESIQNIQQFTNTTVGKFWTVFCRFLNQQLWTKKTYFFYYL